MITISCLATMITVTLLYGSDLGFGSVLKYWGIFLVLGVGSGLLFESSLLSALLQVGTAVAMFAKARFSSALLD